MVKKTLHALTAHLLLACYAAGLFVFVLLGLGRFLHNRILYAQGVLVRQELALQDFSYTDLEAREDGTLVSIGYDPQLVANNPDLQVENVTLFMTYQRPPYLVNVFWKAPGQDYSLRRMAYAQKGEPPQFLLPSKGGQGLRIDPDIQPGSVFTLDKIVVNEKRPFLLFFVPTAAQRGLLLFVPAFAACLLSLLPKAKAGDAL